MRTRAIPINPDTAATQEAHSLMASASQAWQSQTAPNKLAWQNWAQQNPITDTLGQKRVLTGHQAFVQVNTRLLRIGEAALSVPPAEPAPAALTSLSVAAAEGPAGAIVVTFLPTPLGAGLRVWVRAAKVASQGIEYVSNLMKLVYEGSAPEETDIAIGTVCRARLGAFQAGEKFVIEAQVMDEDTGLVSQPLKASCTVTA